MRQQQDNKTTVARGAEELVGFTVQLPRKLWEKLTYASGKLRVTKRDIIITALSEHLD